MKLNTELTTLVLSIIVLILVLTLFYKKSKRQENFESNMNALPSIPINNKPESAYESPKITMDVSPNIEITGMDDKVYEQDPNQENIMMKILQNGNPCDMKAQLEMNFSKMEELQNDMKELKQSFGLKKKN